MKNFLSETDKQMTSIQKLRAKIAETSAEIEAIRSAPMPREDIETKLDSWIAGRADDGLMMHAAGRLLAPKGGFRPDGGIGWTYGGGDKHQPQFDLLEQVCRIMAALAPDQVRAAMMAYVDRRLEHRPPGLPLSERPAALAKLEAQLEKLEIQEEQAITKLEDTGYLVHRRRDARPEIILMEDSHNGR